MSTRADLTAVLLRAPRSHSVTYLEDERSIACYDTEFDAVLRAAIIGETTDGSVKIDDVISSFEDLADAASSASDKLSDHEKKLLGVQ